MVPHTLEVSFQRLGVSLFAVLALACGADDGQSSKDLRSGPVVAAPQASPTAAANPVVASVAGDAQGSTSVALTQLGIDFEDADGTDFSDLRTCVKGKISYMAKSMVIAANESGTFNISMISNSACRHQLRASVLDANGTEIQSTTETDLQNAAISFSLSMLAGYKVELKLVDKTCAGVTTPLNLKHTSGSAKIAADSCSN